MAELASELCEKLGIEAAILLMEKTYKPNVSVSIGKSVITSVVDIKHIDDAWLVYEVTIDQDQSLTFQFDPGLEPFKNTVMGIDGEPICIDCP